MLEDLMWVVSGSFTVLQSTCSPEYTSHLLIDFINYFHNLQTDPIGKPIVQVLKIGNYLNLRCEAKAGTSCYFYLNNGDSHFKKLPYKDNVCVGRVAEEELQRKRSSAGEIFITCAVELVVEGEDTMTSQHSEPLGITIDGEED